MMGDTVKVIETVSCSLIVLLGARLFWVKGKSFLHAWRAFRAAGGAAAAGTKKHSHHAHAAHAHQAHETQAYDVLIAASYVHAAHDHCEHHAHQAHSHEEHADETHEQHEHEHALAIHAHHDSGSAHVTLSAPPLTAPCKAEENAHAHRHRHQHGHHTHHHRHGHTHVQDEEESVLPWGHAHGPEPEELAGPGGWRRGLSAIVAVGLRPCSGAIIVLVFALSQGLYWAGVASTLVMGLGTAITVSSIASLAVSARSVAKRLATSRPGYASLILRGGEAAAGFLVIVLGIALLTGYITATIKGLRSSPDVAVATADRRYRAGANKATLSSVCAIRRSIWRA